MENEKMNAEHYIDETAFVALSNIQIDGKAQKLIKAVLYMIDLCGFDLVERLHIIDRKTGREYK